LERFSQPHRLPAMAGILETKSQLKRRIKMIAKFKKNSRPQWVGAMLLLSVLACVVLTNAYVAKADFVFGTPTNLGPIINSSSYDNSPSISVNGLELYFESDRPGGSGSYDIWVSTRETIQDPWGEPVNLGPPVNKSDWDAVARTTANGLEMYFCSRRSGGLGEVDLWMTKRASLSDPWGEPVNLGSTINSSAFEVGSSISTDGLSLIFDSNRSGGYGRYDLYASTRPTLSDPWSTPVNLGSTVNSSAWDYAPALSADGLSLFFTSLRSGNYEIWLTTKATKDDPWGEPVNLGPVVNSPVDGGNPYISADGSTLYFGSERPGGSGGNDLWQVSILPVVDFNADGNVDSNDVCMMLDFWHTDEPLYDIAPMPFGDGIVDTKDLVLLAEHLTIQTDDPN